jgi:CO dehydrogenase/acetyl-CoA synthase alpha subunit
MDETMVETICPYTVRRIPACGLHLGNRVKSSAAALKNHYGVLG